MTHNAGIEPLAVHSVRLRELPFGFNSNILNHFLCALVRANLTSRRSIVGVGVLDDPHIFNAGKRLAPKLFTIHYSLLESANGTVQKGISM